MEDLIREYQENARHNTETLQVLRLYGEGDWRQDKGAAIQRFIRRTLERELVSEYQRNAEPTEEVKCKLKERVGDQWREEQGVHGREYILVLVKEERAQKRKVRDSENRRIMEEGNQESERPRKKKEIQKVKVTKLKKEIKKAKGKKKAKIRITKKVIKKVKI